MKCAKCQVRDASPGSNFCEKCERGYYSSIDPLYSGNYPFKQFYKDKLEHSDPIQALALLDDVLLIYQYYKTYRIYEPVLRGLTYQEEHERAENYFYELFSNVLEERLSSIRAKFDPLSLKKQFNDFRSLLWHLNQQITERPDSYVGVAEIKPILLFFKKLLRSKEINMSADFIDRLGHFFDPGSAIFILELFSEVASSSDDAIRKLVRIAKTLKNRYGDELIRRVVNFPVVLLKPWKHQELAFEHWRRNNCKGIIEMATATGKTLVGLMAIQKLAADFEQDGRRGHVLITSHSRAILNQWKQEVVDKLGLMADSSDYKIPITNDYVKIEFETIQSLIRLKEIKKVDLLIVDEVHHIVAPVFKEVFNKVRFDQFMGLSASPDEGERANIFKSLNIPTVFRYGLNEAIKDGVLPEFDWYLHPVYMSDEELAKFEELSEKIRKGFYAILEDLETEKFLEKLVEDINQLVDLSDFVRMIEKARYRKLEVPESWRNLALLITQRRWLIHRSLPKIDEAIELAKDYYSAGKKVIIFTMDINSCEYIAEKLDEVDKVFVVHSGISNPFSVLSSFKESDRGVLIGARMLDEGIDIPDAEVGLNVAASKTKIQLVQRLGRILRKYGDKRPVFHHFVGVPDDRSYLEFEDPFWMLDEISWVLDTALSMGANPKLMGQKDVRRLITRSEEVIKRAYRVKDVSLPSYGVIKIEKILSQFDEKVISELVQMLNSMPEDEQITNELWIELLKKAYELAYDGESRALDVKGHWWILVLGDRNPRKIGELISQYAG